MSNTVSSEPASHPIVQLRWLSGVQFEAGRLGAASVRIDGEAQSAPGPFDLLLGATAACASSDVVAILEKQRTPLTFLEVRIDSKRVAGTPRRLASAVLHFSVRGPGLTPDKVARAVELAVTKYCSVRSSLAADIPVTWTIDLQG